MAEIRHFRDLRVWQMGMDLCPVIYSIAARLPTLERYALSDQLRRAAVSVPSNIAEGHARSQTGAYLHFLSIALGSLAEIETLLELAHRLHQADTTSARERVAALRQALAALRGSLRRLSPHPES